MIALKEMTDSDLLAAIDLSPTDSKKTRTARMWVAVMLMDEYFMRQKIRTFHDRADVGHR